MSYGDLTKKALSMLITRQDRIKTSLMLSERAYIKFRAFCQRQGQTPSEVLDYLIIDFNENMAPEIEEGLLECQIKK